MRRLPFQEKGPERFILPMEGFLGRGKEARLRSICYLIAMVVALTSVMILLEFGIVVFFYFRFGLLSSAAGITFFVLLIYFPITTQLSAWYLGTGLTGLAILLAFSLCGFHTSLGGQPLFGRASLED